jgi:6-phosphogluconate dehydrogenase
VQRLDPIFKTLAPGIGSIEKTPARGVRKSTAEDGYLYTGPAGSGHFVKMIHNGIEYGLMQAYAEGLDILKGVAQESVPAERRYNLDLAEITEVWRRGSVVASWLLDLTADALARDPELKTFGGRVSDSGEGRWTILAAIEEGVPAPVLSSALYERFSSRNLAEYADKICSAMRFEFGGHLEKPAGSK